MRKVLFAFCFLSVSVFVLKAEDKINPAKPFEVNLTAPANPNSETVEIKIRKPDSDEQSEIVTNFELKKCIVTDNAKKKIQVFPEGVSPSWTCLLSVAQPNGQGVGMLSSNWTSLSLKVEYTYTDSNGVSQNRVYSIDNPPISKCTRTAQIDAEIDSQTLRPNEDSVLVKVTLNTDLRAKLSLKKNGDVFARQEGQDQLLSKGENRVLLKKKEGVTLASGTYMLEVEASNSEKINDRVKDVFIKAYSPYKIRNISPSKITPDDSGNVRFTVNTNDNGTLELYLNGKKLQAKERNNLFEFSIENSQLDSGANSITFKGTNDDDLPLEDAPTLSLVKEVATYLDKSTIKFALEGDVLTIKYKLTRKLRNRWQFVDSTGKPGLGIDSEPSSPDSNEYIAKINLANSDQSAPIKDVLDKTKTDAYKQTAPVKIQIVNPGSSDDNVIAEFSIDFIKPTEKVTKKMKKAEELLAANKKDEAKAEIRTAFDFGSTEEDKKAVDAIVASLKGGETPKEKTFKALLIAGRITAGFFGIPLPF